MTRSDRLRAWWRTPNGLKWKARTLNRMRDARLRTRWRKIWVQSQGLSSVEAYAKGYRRGYLSGYQAARKRMTQEPLDMPKAG